MEKQGEEHIWLSPPHSSPANSNPSPPHSKHTSEDHISLTPSPLRPPGNHPSRPDHVDFHHTPESERRNPAPPPVLSRNVFNEPADNRIVLAEPTPVTGKAVLEADSPPPTAELDAGWRRRYKPSLSVLSGAKREKMVKKAALGFRVFGFLFCLVSFSVMTADRNRGWALDSFDRYTEFRYCMLMNLIGFIYSAAQAIDLAYHLATGKYTLHRQHYLRRYFDFVVDQMIAYLLISASSSAVVRVNDWQSNWGKDKFPDMAGASISMSFLAFVALGISSLISGYALCTSKL